MCFDPNFHVVFFFRPQVFRPVCGKGLHSVYCYINGNCETDLTRCRIASSSSSANSHIFAMGSGCCPDMEVSSESASPLLLSDNYELIIQSPVFLSSAGCHMFPFNDLTNSTDVKEDDILGFSYQLSGFAEITSRKSYPGDRFNTTSFSFENTALSLGSILNTPASPT